jgi:predicted phage terminase large subunit-like protein
VSATLRGFFEISGLAKREPRTVLPFHELIFNTLERLVLDSLPDGARNLIINIPPRHGKTLIAEDFVAWAMGWLPDCHFLLTGYSSEITNESARKIRETMNSDWFAEAFAWQGGFFDRACRDRGSHFETVQGGAVYSAGVGGALTGFGAGNKRAGFGGAIVIDDPLKASETQSAASRKVVNDWYTSTLRSRKNSDDVPVILIMQRLAPDDLVAHVQSIEPGLWHVIKIPAQNSDGSVIWERTVSAKSLEILKSVDPFTYYSQYQQEPIVAGGNMLKRDWWRRFRLSEFAPTGTVAIFADTAYSVKTGADPTSLQVWSLQRNGIFLLDALCKRMEFPELVQETKKLWNKWRDGKPNQCRHLFVEAKASGLSLVQTMCSEGVDAQAWNPKDYDFPEDKVGRAKEMSWGLYGGNIHIPYGDELKEADELVNEAAAFTETMTHSHDDRVDTTTMAYSLWRYYSGGQRSS